MPTDALTRLVLALADRVRHDPHCADMVYENRGCSCGLDEIRRLAQEVRDGK